MKQTTPQQAIEAKAASIVLVKYVQLMSEEYKNIDHYMVSDEENARNLSEYLAKKQRYDSFKTSLN